ncbi:hemolysin D [Bryobacterales bacterium F-183]|nr:hemolysin D [Bryobacterales bacterium F-183]
MLLLSAIVALSAQEVVTVQQKPVTRTLPLPGELLPYQRTAVQARANGYIRDVLVDRGSVVRKGQTLATLDAPELNAQTAEAESKVQQAAAAKAEAEARLAAARATYERLQKAAATPGAIAGNELVQAEKAVDAAQASVRAADNSILAAQAVVRATKQAEAYLQVTAPFDGVVTERFLHPGALASAGPVVELQQIARLRLVVPVPEAQVVSIRNGSRVEFRAPAFPGRTFAGIVARVDRSLDPKTRSMPVELDVANPQMELAPGMYVEVAWPGGSGSASLLVPPTAVVTTTERTFVIRVRKDGRAEWVNVRKGTVAGDAVEVQSAGLAAGDMVVKRGSDELREGTVIRR